MKEEKDEVLDETIKNLKSTSIKNWIKAGLIVAVLFGAWAVANICFGVCIDC